MIVKRIFVLTLFLLPLAKPVSAGEQVIKLSLGEAIKMAAERNLDIRAEFYNPAQYEADIHRNRSIYDPLLTLLTDYADSTSRP